MSKIIDRFKKNALEVIRASLTEYNGHQLVDLRTWTEYKAFSSLVLRQTFLRASKTLSK